MTVLFSRRSDHLNTALNLGFALGAAVLIWAGVGARLTQTKSVVMPLEIVAEKGIDFQVLDRAQRVRVTLAGPSAALNSLSSNLALEQIYLRPKLYVTSKSLEDKIKTNYVLNLDPNKDIKLPSRLLNVIRVVSIEPKFVKLNIAPSVERVYATASDIPAIPRLSNVSLDRVDLTIDRVTVRGSLLAIEAFEARQRKLGAVQNGQVVVKIEPFDVGNANESFTLIRRFQLPKSLIGIPKRTEVTVVLKKAEEQQDSRSFELAVCFLLPSPVKSGFIYELRPPRDTITVQLTGSRSELDKFERQLKMPEPDRQPYAVIRVPAGSSVGPQSGEIAIGNFNPENIRIKGDKTTVYQIRKAD